MDAHELVTGIRWDLLQLLGFQARTGAELARLLGTSPANISQHLKLLELAGLVVKERANGKSMHYRLAGERALITVLSGQSFRSIVPLEGVSALSFRLLTSNLPHSKLLRRFVLEYEPLVQSLIGFGLLPNDDKGNCQLFVLATDVKTLRKEHAHIKIADQKIIIWSHTPEEVADGLGRHEHYFVDMLQRMAPLYDPSGQLRELKESQA